jgi:sugar lactone lactonase YvrE/phosphodiesterase/alkaline phosphatase D-like protein
MGGGRGSRRGTPLWRGLKLPQTWAWRGALAVALMVTLGGLGALAFGFLTGVSGHDRLVASRGLPPGLLLGGGPPEREALLRKEPSLPKAARLSRRVESDATRPSGERRAQSRLRLSEPAVYSNDGLPAGERVPSWASGKPGRVRFVPTGTSLAATTSTGDAGAGAAGAGVPAPQAPAQGPSSLRSSSSAGGVSELDQDVDGNQDDDDDEGIDGAPIGTAGRELLGRRCQGTYCPNVPLRFDGGPVQREPKLHVIFWGSNWNEPAGSATRTQVLNFYKGLSGSAWQGTLTQYFDAEGHISSNVAVNSFTDERTPMIEQVNDEKLEREVAYALSEEAKTGWTREPNAQFIVVTAPGSSYEARFLGEGFCAFHSEDSVGSSYTFLPYMGDEPFVQWCTDPYDQNHNIANTTSMLASHEYAESATDPDFYTRPGWKDSEGDEVADICISGDDEITSGSLSGSWVQGLWDDHESRCSLGDQDPPHVLGLTDEATEIGEHEATLNATLNDEDEPGEVSYRFEYGPTTSYGNSIPAAKAPPIGAGSGIENHDVQQTITGLTPETTYHYRVVATNSAGETAGEDQTATISKWVVPALPATTRGFTAYPIGASCTSTQWCMFVGNEWSGSYAPYSESWNGTKWSSESVPVGEQIAGQFIWGVSCTSATACAAVGEGHLANAGYVPLVENWNGTQWSTESLPLPSGATEAGLSSVSCFSASECIAVGWAINSSGTTVPYAALRQKDGAWTEQVMQPVSEGGAISALSGVSCTPAASLSATSCMAVGRTKGEAAVIASGTGFAERWTGKQWSIVSPKTPEGLARGELLSVSCTSASACTAVGSFLGPHPPNSGRGGWGGWIEAWNGSSWTEQNYEPANEFQDGLLSVSCSAPQACTAVGAFEIQAGHWVTEIQGLSGGSWRHELTTTEDSSELDELVSVSCVQESTCLAVGQNGTQLAEMEGFNYQRPATVVTGTAVGIAKTSATLNATVNPHGAQVSECKLEYGITTSYGSSAPCAPSPGSGTSPVAVSASATGLTPNSTYYYRVSATNAAGASYGEGRAFETLHATAVSSITPASGTTAGGTAVTIKGFDFVAPATVTMGGAATSVEVISETEIKATTAATTSGSREVVVSDADGISAEGPSYTYAPTGASYTSSFGSLGSGGGQLNHPEGVAVDAKGDLWVVDTGNYRVEEFSPGGTFMRTFGWGVQNGAAEFQTCSSHCQVGLSGSGPGQLGAEGEYKGAAGIALASEAAGGDIWVGDPGNRRVDEFKPEATNVKFEMEIGANGPDKFTLGNPIGVAVDAAGDVWVADFQGGLDEFSSSGAPLRQVASIDPDGVVVDPATGNIWTTEADVNRVSEFSAAGVLVESFGWGVNGGEGLQTCTANCKPGVMGSGDGEFFYPNGISVGPHGHVWVADSYNGRVEEFSANGEYVAQFGSPGGGPGQLSYPWGVAVLSGTAYVVDSHNSRVERWAAWETTPTVATTAASSVTQTGATLNATVNPNGSEVGACKFEYGTTTSYGSSVPCTRSPGSGTSAVAVSASVTGLTVNTTYHFRVSAANAGGPSYGSDETFVARFAPTYTSVFGSLGSGNGQLDEPTGDALDSEGNVWVADSANDRVEEFSSTGTFVKAFGWGVKDGKAEAETCTAGCKAGIAGSGNGQFSGPAGIAIAPKGEIWVSDALNSRVEEFSAEGKYLKQFGSAGGGSGQFAEPEGLALASNGDLWVADTRYGRIEEFSPEGAFIREVKLNTGFFGVAIDASGDVWSTDVYDARVVELSSEGAFIKAVGWGVKDGKAEAETCTESCQNGIVGSANGQFDSPEGIAVDAHGDVWTVDSYNHRVQELSSTGEYLTQFGSPGSGPGQLWYPSGIAVAGRSAYVSDKSNNDVEKWAAFETSPAPTVVTKPATSISQTTVTLNAAVNPNGAEVGKCEFEYGTTTSYGKTAACTPSAGSGEGAVAVSAAIAALTANTTYHFRISATNTGGTSYGSDGTFKTLASAPAVVTKAASSITQTAATLNASVNPNGSEVTSCKLEYGTTTSYGSSAACTPSPGSGESPVAVSAALTGLTANTTYHFRVVATSAAGTGNGSDEAFKTLPNAPTVVTKAASSVAQTTASLNATVNPNGGEVSSCKLEYGTTTSYGSSASCTPSPGSGTSAVAVSAALTGLTANATYHFRVVATNAGGTSNGSDETLKTLASAPAVVTKAASAILQTAVALNASVNPNGAEVSKCEFEYGTTTSYGKTATCTPSPGSGTAPVAVSARVSGLTANTTYHFRIAATNSSGASKGSDETLKTLQAPSFTSSFGSSGAGAGQVSGPAGVALDSKGNVWVADSANNRVDEFSSTGTFTKAFGWGVSNGKSEAQTCTSSCKAGVAGSGNGEFKKPWGVAIAPTGEILVSDVENNRVQEFSAEGKYVRQFGTKGTGNGQFSEPAGLAALSSGNVWVADAGNNRVQEFSSEGKYITQVGSLSHPQGIAVDSSSNVWVVDSHNSRVEELSSSGTFLAAFGWGVSNGKSELQSCTSSCKAGIAGSGNGQFKEATGIAVDSQGELWVVDGANSRVEEFSPTGEFIIAFGAAGTGSGQFSKPWGIGLAGGSAYVADGGNNRLQRWAVAE